jgi:hypothetical protein
MYYVGKDGRFVWRNRHARIANVGSLVTFGDSTVAGSTEIGYSNLRLDYDETWIYNEVRVQRTGSTTIHTATDSTSQGKYFQRTLSITGLENDSSISSSVAENEADSMAQYLLRQYREPVWRARELEMRPDRSETYWPWALGLEIDDRVTVKRRPPGGGSTMSVECYVEGIEHDIQYQRGEWTTRLHLSPADTTSYWILGDANRSQLSTTTILAF